MSWLIKITNILNRFVVLIAGISLVGMMFLACLNMLLRSIWIPLKGTFELMGFLGAIVTAFALGYTQIKRANIAVDILVIRFSTKKKKIVDSINYIINAIFFGLIAWQTALWATTLVKTSEVSETLRIIYYPFTYGVALGAGVLSLILFIDFIETLSSKIGGEK